ncbi:MAG: fumarylacetoacetate hydrolase family protein [Novosphingobium sp.]
MRIARFGPIGAERVALVDATGNLRDASDHVVDICAANLDHALKVLSAIDPADLPVVPADARIGACIGGVGKFVCIGLNYHDHAREAGREIPTEPVIFMKATSAICGADDPFEIPRGASQCDWEVELGVIMGKRAKYVDQAAALDYVAGYCTINDGSERHFQSHRQGQWTKGKSHDSFGPIGPWFVTADDVPDPQALRVTCDVDGVRYQDGSTADMIFPVAEIVSYLSQFMTLMPGDIIATGTPAGVGLGVKPEPVYLRAGQVLEVEVEGLGRQRHMVVTA